MVRKNHHLQRFFQPEFSFKISRIVFMSGGHGGPQTLDQIRDEEDVKEAIKLQENFKGFYLTAPFDKDIEDRELGIRDHLGHVLEKEHEEKTNNKRKAYDILIDADITAELRKRVKEDHEHHKTNWRFVPGSSEWRHNRAKEIKNVARAIWSPIKWFRDDFDEGAADLEHEYGHASDVNEMKKSLIKKFESLLAPGHLSVADAKTREDSCDMMLTSTHYRGE